MSIDIDKLANEIRRVDGKHKLGAGALAELLAPFINRELEACRSAMSDLLSWFPEKPSDPEWRLKGGANGADEAVAAERISHMPAFGSRAGEMARRLKQIEKDGYREPFSILA